MPDTIIYKNGSDKRPSLRHIYQGMMTRCCDPMFKGYRHYGGRGIKVCDEWFYSYPKFKNYIFSVIGPRPSKRHTLDRINVNGDYEPGNLQWATWTEQHRNRQVNVKVEMDGKLRNIIDICEERGLSYSTVMDRHYAGWKDEDLFRPIRKWARTKE